MLKISKNVAKISRNTCFNNVTRNNLTTSSFALKSAISSTKQNVEAEAASSSESINISTKILHTKGPKREPLLKNLFLGIVDKDLLAYPESLNREEQANINQVKSRYEKCFLDKEADIGGNLKNAGIFGAKIPLTFGGTELIETELSLLNEIVAGDIRTCVSSTDHNTIATLIDEKGSDLLKKRYLEKMASGKCIGAIAIFESEAPTDGMFHTKAVLNEDEKSWTLNGRKSYILGGNDANLLLVLATTETIDHIGDKQGTVTAFLVDAAEKGVQRKEIKTIGFKDAPQIQVDFENVVVSNDNILGKSGGGADIAIHLLKLHRMRDSVLGINLMKRTIQYYADLCINTRTPNGSLMEMDLLRERVARSVCAIYAAESMVYMTNSLTDDFQDQDIELEAAATKCFVADNLLNLACDPLKFAGPKILVEGHEMEQHFRDAIQYYGKGETIDSIKLFSVLSGLQHSGIQLNEMVKKERNPAMNPSYIISRLFDKNCVDKPVQHMHLEYNLHPTLDPAAQWLEFSIIRLQLTTQLILSRYGNEVLEKHVELMRLAECAQLVYAMFCSISRASRAYCIGLKHADYEMLIANTFCLEASERCKYLAKRMEEGPYITNDNNFIKIGKQLFKSKGYFAEHPLTRNF